MFNREWGVMLNPSQIVLLYYVRKWGPERGVLYLGGTLFPLAYGGYLLKKGDFWWPKLEPQGGYTF